MKSAMRGSWLALAVLILVAATPLAQAQYEVLHRFQGKADGGFPAAGVILDAAGNLYGTTGGGGTYGRRVVFTLDKTNKETVLHTLTNCLT